MLVHLAGKRQGTFLFPRWLKDLEMTEAFWNSENMRETGDSMDKRNVQRRRNKRQHEKEHKHIEMERYLGQTDHLENVKETQELIRVIYKHCSVMALPPGCHGGSWSK